MGYPEGYAIADITIASSLCAAFLIATIIIAVIAIVIMAKDENAYKATIEILSESPDQPLKDNSTIADIPKERWMDVIGELRR